MKKLTCILFIFTLIASIAWAAVPKQIRNDVILFGIDGSASVKEFFFDVGDGASNPKLSVDPAVKEFNLSKKLNIAGDLSMAGTQFETGDGTSQDLNIIHDMGSGASNPDFNYNVALGSWTFTNEGGPEKKLGSGAGGGGVGQNILLNPGFEDGTGDWTNSVGTYTSEGTIRIEGEKSAKVTLSAQTLDFYQYVVDTNWNDKTVYASCYIKSSVADIQVCFTDGTDDFNCMDYDASNVWKKANGFIPKVVSGLMGLRVKTKTAQTGDVYIDGCVVGDGVQVGTSVEEQTLVLETANGVGSTGVYIRRFLTIGKSIGSGLFTYTDSITDGASFTVDRTGCSYDFSYTDNFPAQEYMALSVDSTAISTIVNTLPISDRRSMGLTSGASFPMNVGFEETLPLGTIVRPHTSSISVGNVTRTGMVIHAKCITSGLAVPGEIGTQIIRYDGFASRDGSGHIKFKTKQYNKGPNGGDTYPLFSDDNATRTKIIATKTSDFHITANLERSGGAVRGFVIRFNSSDIEQEKIEFDTSGSGFAMGVSPVLRMLAGDYIVISGDTNPVDVAFATVLIVKAMPVYMKLLAQVPFPVDNSRGNVRVESCGIDNNGTATKDANSGLCESWINATTRNALGTVRVQFEAGSFALEPVCNCDSENTTTTTKVCTKHFDATHDNTEMTFRNFVSSSSAAIDGNFSITCQGVK